jgi:hypothetical protein
MEALDALEMEILLARIRQKAYRDYWDEQRAQGRRWARMYNPHYMVKDSKEDAEGNLHSESSGRFVAKGGGKTSAEEKQRKIDSVQIDFSRDNMLPELNPEDLAKLGVPSKPVLLKKNIIDRNLARHPDVIKEDFATILSKSLYSPDLVVRETNPGKENYYHFIKHDSKSNSLVLIELSENKDYHEIVHLYRVDIISLNRLLKNKTN